MSDTKGTVHIFKITELKEIDKSSLASDVFQDDTEKTEYTLPLGIDLDKQIAGFEKLSETVNTNSTFFQRLRNLEFVVNFRDTKTLVIVLGAFASAAGLLSGLDQSIISGASIGMRKSLHLNSHEDSLVSSLMPLGATAGSIMMTPLNEYAGRKKSIIISCLWYTLGAALCAGSHSHQMMYAGRFILGIGVGIEGGCVGIYIAESVPPSVRGSLVSLYQFNIALGEVLGYAVAAIFYEVDGGWRFMVGSSLVFSTLLLIGCLFLPESPRYLVYKQKIGEAFSVWKRLRDLEVVDNKIEFIEMVQVVEQELDRKREETRIQVWLDLILVPRNRRALIYAVLMVALGQLTGVNAVMYYMSTLMSRIGFDEKKSVFMSLVGGGSLLIGTIPAVFWMDKFGRRKWGLNIVGFFVGLVLMGIGYEINLQRNLAAAEGVYLSGLILYMAFFGSYACLQWVCPSESFAVRTRTIGMSICSAFLYLWSFTVTYNFTKMQSAMTSTGLVLGFYGGIAFIGFFYQILYMPETKDKTLEEIDDLFSMPSWELARLNIKSMKKFWGLS